MKLDVQFHCHKTELIRPRYFGEGGAYNLKLKLVLRPC
jgi:hypothetical protein